jgi:NOL1/NOP2/sun family putative RNA methylase
MKNRPELKEQFVERIEKILGNEKDIKEYLEIIKEEPVRSIRCNKLKISPDNLKKRLEKKRWEISQPWSNYPEVMIIKSQLLPGELGRSVEHLLGYYYIQELASMLPIIALKPKPHEKFLDLCASPGSKTTQTASEMQNTGLIIANEKSLGRIKILASNLERCGVTNAILTQADGEKVCNDFKSKEIFFDKILVDAPCSGEGTLRSTKSTYSMWNTNTIKKLSKIQKRLFKSAFEILKPEGQMIYSTCTHAPEENEEIVDYALKEFEGKIKVEKIILPEELELRPGITKWEDKEYLEDVKMSCRIYPHVNNTEGFFLSKFTKIKD